MKIYQSEVKEIGSVSFPEFKGERVYMVPFYQKEGLPQNLKRWQTTVDQMLKGISTDQPIYLMIDETFVPAAKEQRRPGVHIDGYWLPEKNSHGSGHGGKSSLSGSHGGHKSNKNQKGSWETAEFDIPEALILASNISASRGFIGEFKGPIKEMGDCSHISTKDLQEVSLEAHKAYMGNVTFLHESLPVKNDCYRTLVRLNVPGVKL